MTQDHAGGGQPGEDGAPGLSVVVMAFDEAANLGPVVEEALEVFRGRGEPFELILVDDASRDATPEVMAALAAAHPEVRAVRHRDNGGIGRAVRTGFRLARRRWVTLMPADGQVPPAEIARLRDLAPPGGIAISTYTQRGDVDSPLRMVLSRGLRLAVRGLTGVAERMDSIYVADRAMLSALPLRATTFFVNLELPLRALRAGLPHAAAEITCRPRRSGASKVVRLGVVRRVAADLLRFRAQLWVERARPAPPFLATPDDWPADPIPARRPPRRPA